MGDPWTPGFIDVLRWKLRLGSAAVEPPADETAAVPPTAAPSRAIIECPDQAQVVATWIGHSTFLLQVAGLNILTDPIFSDHCSPAPIRRLKRSLPPALAIPELPRIDLILLSHAHYDHLDHASLRQLDPGIPVACPLGLGRKLQSWGFRKAVEFGWGDGGTFGEARLDCLPVQHGSARTPFDRDRSLWCGWMLEVNGRKIFFCGDTGYAPYFPELFAPYAPVDLALLPIGAYAPRWFMQPLHMNPAEAIRLHRDLGSRFSIAMHWGTFRLADEPLCAPATELRAALGRTSIGPTEFRLAAIGESILLPTAAPAPSPS